MADDQTIEDDSGDNLNMSHGQLMELLDHVAKQRNLPVASPYQPQQTQQAPAPPKPQVAPIPANVPQAGKVLDQASGAYVRPDTAKNLDWFRQTGDQLQKQDEEKAQQQTAQPQNKSMLMAQRWAEDFHRLNPKASAEDILSLAKTAKEAGLFGQMDKQSNTMGKTVEEQLYSAAIKEGKSPEEAAKVSQQYKAGGSLEDIEARKATMSKGTAEGKLQGAAPGSFQAIKDSSELIEQNSDDMINIAQKLMKDYPIASKSGPLSAGLSGYQNYAPWADKDFAEGVANLKQKGSEDLLPSIKAYLQGTGQVRVFEGINLDKIFSYNESEPMPVNIARWKDAKEQVMRGIEGARALRNAQMTGKEQSSGVYKGNNLQENDPLGLF